MLAEQRTKSTNKEAQKGTILRRRERRAWGSWSLQERRRQGTCRSDRPRQHAGTRDLPSPSRKRAGTTLGPDLQPGECSGVQVTEPGKLGFRFMSFLDEKKGEKKIEPHSVRKWLEGGRGTVRGRLMRRRVSERGCSKGCRQQGAFGCWLTSADVRGYDGLGHCQGTRTSGHSRRVIGTKLQQRLPTAHQVR
jgi:hypothetical protein